MPSRANAQAGDLGAAAYVLADRSHSTITDTRRHAVQWLAKRFGVRRNLAAVVAELAGLGGRRA
jgi:hypothetical protein